MAINQDILTSKYYELKRKSVLNRFSKKFKDTSRNEQLAAHVLEMLIRDTNPYEIIEKLIDINSNNFKKIEKMMIYAPPTPYVMTLEMAEKVRLLKKETSTQE